MEKLSPKEAGLERIRDLDVLSTIPEMLALQVEKRPDAVGWKSWDPVKKSWRDWTFRQGYDEVQRWRHAFAGLGLTRGTRVAMLLPNCIEAVLFDQAALANALTPVPLHAIDTPKSSAYILNDSGAEVLVTNKKLKWRLVREAAELPNLKLVVITDDDFADDPDADIPMLSLETWLAKTPDAPLPPGPRSTDLAALVYTSGTTGNPKGVMLTHRNVLSNLRGVLQSLQPYADETLLSFLPLSHTFERTASYYLAVGTGLTLAFNRSIATLADDLKFIRPTILMSVPRVYDMIYGKLRDSLAKKPAYVRYLFNWAVEVGWRRFCRENGLPIEPSGRAWLDPLVAGFLDKKIGKQLRSVFGDRIHLYISGGAALNPAVAKVFLGLGVPIFQGYGMTETAAPFAATRVTDNVIGTVGQPAPGSSVRISDDGELQVKGPNVFMGYHNLPEKTAEVFTEDGWLRTGDLASIDDEGRITITGRKKDIIITAGGKNVSPIPMEQEIAKCPIVEHAVVVGDNRPFIGALVTLDPEGLAAWLPSVGLSADTPLDRVAATAAVHDEIQKYVDKANATVSRAESVRKFVVLDAQFTQENKCLTPSLKVVRPAVNRVFADVIDQQLYAGKR